MSVKLLIFIREANEIAKLLKRNITLKMRTVRKMETFPQNGKIVKGLPAIVVRVHNKEEKYYYDWSAEKFRNRLSIMRALSRDFLEDGVLDTKVTKDTDPFWDPPNPILVGQAFMKMCSLPFLLNES